MGKVPFSYMEHNQKAGIKSSLSGVQIALGVIGIIALLGYFIYQKYGFFMIPGLFYARNTVTYETNTDIVAPYKQDYIEELPYTVLTTSMEPKMSPFREDFCTVIQDKETYQKYVAAYGGELCKDCVNFDFTKYSILGQVIEDVEYDSPGIPGFNKYVFKDRANNIITYIVASKDVYNPKTNPLIEEVDAAYLEQDMQWLIKIPRIPDYYTVECQSFANS